MINQIWKWNFEKSMNYFKDCGTKNISEGDYRVCKGINFWMNLISYIVFCFLGLFILHLKVWKITNQICLNFWVIMTKYHPYLLDSHQLVVLTKHYLALILQSQPKVFNFHQFLCLIYLAIIIWNQRYFISEHSNLWVTIKLSLCQR